MEMDPTEFRKLVEAHQRMVFSIALRLTGDRGTAEEVAQDTFLELFQVAESLTNGDHIRFWLRRAAVHRAIDACRSNSRRPELAADPWSDEDHGGELASLPRPDSGWELQGRVQELLQALPELLRIAVILRYQEEMAPEEIATLLQQPLATVKSHLQRGLQLLRRKAAVTLKEYVR